MKKPRFDLWSVFWAVAALLYFFVPLYGTFDFSLRMKKGEISLQAYQLVFSDPQFLRSFQYSTIMGIISVTISILIFVPTVYWLYLKLPKARPFVEIVTILPFVIPVIVYVYGINTAFGGAPLRLTSNTFTTDILMVGGYVVLSMPYMFRAIDVGMRTIDVRTLTEAAQSMGAGWAQILFNVIFPNLRIAILSGSLICFATVIGELILGDFLLRPALGPYMAAVGRDKAFEPAALAIISYALTWASLGLIQAVSHGGTSQQQLTGR